MPDRVAVPPSEIAFTESTRSAGAWFGAWTVSEALAVPTPPSRSATDSETVGVPAVMNWCDTEKVPADTDCASGALPSPKSNVAVNVSPVPGSWTVTLIITVSPSSTEDDESETPTVGGTFATARVALALVEAPAPSVTVTSTW